MKYMICPQCGAHLDFGESCDCGEEKKRDKQKGVENDGGNITAAGGGVSRNDD